MTLLAFDAWSHLLSIALTRNISNFINETGGFSWLRILRLVSAAKSDRLMNEICCFGILREKSKDCKTVSALMSIWEDYINCVLFGWSVSIWTCECLGWLICSQINLHMLLIFCCAILRNIAIVLLIKIHITLYIFVR